MSLHTDSRPPTRPLVLALHSSAGSARQWRGLADLLSASHHVHAVDLHDHGAGPAWAKHVPLTLEDEAALVAPLLAAAGTVAEGAGAHLVGHSYGGAVALKVAAMHPRRVRSLTLYEPAAFRLLFDDAASAAETDEIVAVAAAMQTALERHDRPHAAQRFIDYWSGPGSWAALPATAREGIAARMPAVLQHFGALFNERQQVRDVSRLALPVLLLRGDQGPATTRRLIERLRALLPHARHETLPAMGHMGPVTHAELVNGHIGAFLQEMRPRHASHNTPRTPHMPYTPQTSPAADEARFPMPPELVPGPSVPATTTD